MIKEIFEKTAYLFDMDGTLVNTEPVGAQVLGRLFAEHQVTLTDEENDLFVKVWRRDGTDVKEDAFIEALRIKYSIATKSKEFLNHFFDLYKQAIIVSDALPGVDLFLRKSHESGKKLAIVTSSKRDQAKAILDFHEWNELFALIVAEEDITHFKPNPEPFLVAANNLNTEPESCVVFEDAKNGAIAGKAAGMYVVGLRAGNEIDQDLFSASIVVNSFDDLV